MDTEILLNYIEDVSLDNLFKQCSGFVEKIENSDSVTAVILDVVINCENSTATIYYQE
jgi:hypothetical protein